MRRANAPGGGVPGGAGGVGGGVGIVPKRSAAQAKFVFGLGRRGVAAEYRRSRSEEIVLGPKPRAESGVPPNEMKGVRLYNTKGM